MRWTSKARWLLLAVAWRSITLKAAPAANAILSSLADADKDEPTMQPAVSDASSEPETESNLAVENLHRSLLNSESQPSEDDAEKTATSRKSNAAGYSEAISMAGYNSGKNTRHGGHLRAPRRSSKIDYGSLTPTDYASDQQEAGIGEERKPLARETPPSAEPETFSHLQLGATQIFDQLLTGFVGTGLNLLNTGPQPATIQPVSPVEATPVYAPTASAGPSIMEIILIISGSILIVGLICLIVWLVTSTKKKKRRR